MKNTCFEYAVSAGEGTLLAYGKSFDDDHIDDVFCDLAESMDSDEPPPDLVIIIGAALDDCVTGL